VSNVFCHSSQPINTPPIKRSRSRDVDSGIGVISDDATMDDTPRPLKRRRDLHNTYHFSRPASPTKSESNVSISSHKSGRLSPVKQIQALEDFEHPVTFRDFDSLQVAGKRQHQDVTAIQGAIQTLADGVGIVEDNSTDAFKAGIAELPELDRKRLLYETARSTQRGTYGSTPVIEDIVSIVCAARELNAGAGGAEDEWNTDVQYPILKLALKTSRHSKALSIRSV